MAASSETASLLQQASVVKANGQALKGILQEYDTIPSSNTLEDAGSGSTSTWRTEGSLLGRYATPLIVTYVLQYSYTFVTIFVAGRLGTSELAASSLATMTANITGLSVYEGLATSLDTLTSQAFGAGKKHLVGLHVQRMIALVLLATVPIGAVWICSPWLLALIVPEKHVAYLAGDFLRFYLIGAPGYGVFEAVKRFTQAQGDFMGPMVTALICAPLNLFWNWLFVFVSTTHPIPSHSTCFKCHKFSMSVFAHLSWICLQACAHFCNRDWVLDFVGQASPYRLVSFVSL